MAISNIINVFNDTIKLLLITMIVIYIINESNILNVMILICEMAINV